MNPIIIPHSEICNDYNNIAKICRASKAPVFLTRDGAGDTVIMDMETYALREENLLAAERLLSAEKARFDGASGYSLSEFKDNMLEAIAGSAGDD